MFRGPFFPDTVYIHVTIHSCDSLHKYAQNILENKDAEITLIHVVNIPDKLAQSDYCHNS